MNRPIDLVVLISGNGSNLQAIIDAINTGRLDARIQAVISNQPNAYGLVRAQQQGITNIVVDHRDYGSREAFEQVLLDRLRPLNPDYIVLAGFMRILGSNFIQAFANRILNIHPSILPAYKGLDTHERALQDGEKEHGVSIHLVTARLDDGPILAQGRYPIDPDDSIEDLQRKGHELEHRMYPAVLQWLSRGKMQIQGNDIVYQNETLHQPVEFDQD